MRSPSSPDALPRHATSLPAGHATPGRHTDARAVAVEVARRVTDYARLNAHRLERGAGDAAELARGDIGLAAACAYLDACSPAAGWDVVAHDFLSRGASAAEDGRLTAPGLFHGLAGIAFAAGLLSRGGARYGRLLGGLEPMVVAEAAALTARVRSAAGATAAPDVDLVTGISGIGAYLLGRVDRRDTLLELMRALAGLAHPSAVRPQACAGARPDHGVAHGLAGPLSVMALALRAGVEAPDQAVAVRAMAAWLADAELADASIPAWCSGAAGIARAVWLAGDALGDRGLCDAAVAAMATALHRAEVGAAGPASSPTFCHGLAGLLHLTLRFARDTGLPQFAQAADVLIDELLAAYDADSLFGYATLEHGRRVDRPGLVDGAAGVALVLLAASTDVDPAWDRIFLIA